MKQVVGQTRTLNTRLEVASGAEQTTVTESLVQPDKVDATIGSAIELAQIDNLPHQRQKLGNADLAGAGRDR